MSPSLDVNGIRFESCATIAHRFGYTSDYAGRLAREGKVRATRVGRLWFIDPVSFESFIAESQKKKVQRSYALRTQRQRERRTVAPRIPHTISVSQDTVSILRTEAQTVMQALVVCVCGVFAGALVWYTLASGTTLVQLETGASLVWRQVASAVMPYGSQAIAQVQFGSVSARIARIQERVSRSKHPPSYAPTAMPMTVADEYVQTATFATFPTVDYVSLQPDQSQTEVTDLLPFSDEVRVIDTKDGGIQVVQPVYDAASGETYEVYVSPISRTNEAKP